jgi:pimeloyl-ACP methyl ester carboxylesterase
MTLEIISREPTTVTHTTPLLFVHGAWHGAWCWDETFMPYFANRGYRTYALSLRGHGGSSGWVRGARIHDYVADVAQIAEQIPRWPVVIGHSMGGLITQHFIETHDVAGAVLVAAAPPGGALGDFLRIMATIPGPAFRSLFRMDFRELLRTPQQAQEMFFSPDMPADQVARHFARLGDESFPVFFDMMLFGLPHPQRVRAPVLVLGAANDRIISNRDVHNTARAYRTQAVMFDMAHDMMLEPGWQAVADRIVQWLDEHDL